MARIHKSTLSIGSGTGVSLKAADIMVKTAEIWLVKKRVVVFFLRQGSPVAMHATVLSLDSHLKRTRL